LSYSVDVNILLHASNRSSEHFSVAEAFLNDCLGRDELFCVAYPTVMGYLRIATHPRIFPQPLSPAEALENMRNLAQAAHVRLIGEAQSFLDGYTEVTALQPARGNDVPDAHLATILRQHGVRLLYTTDRDFDRFPFLITRNPLL